MSENVAETIADVVASVKKTRKPRAEVTVPVMHFLKIYREVAERGGTSAEVATILNEKYPGCEMGSQKVTLRFSQLCNQPPKSLVEAFRRNEKLKSIVVPVTVDNETFDTLEFPFKLKDNRGNRSRIADEDISEFADMDFGSKLGDWNAGS